MRTKTLVFFSGIRDADKVKKLVSSSGGLAERIVVATNPSAEKHLAELKIGFRKIADYFRETAYDNGAEEAVLLLRKWGAIKLSASEKALKELMVYKGLPMWEVIEYNFASLIFEQQNILAYFRQAKAAIEKEHPGKIIVCGPDPFFARVVSDIAAAAKIDVKLLGTAFSPAAIYRSQYIEPKMRHYLNALNILRKRFLSLQSQRKGNPAAKNRIAVIVPIETAVPVIAPVIRLLQKNESNDIAVFSIGSLRERVQKSLDAENIRSLPLEMYFDGNAIRKMNEAKAYFLNVWKMMDSDADFKKRITIEGIPVWNSLRDAFRYYFSARMRLAEIVGYAETTKNMLAAKEPDVLVIVDECSEIAKPVAIIARQHGAKTLAIQHGMYTESILIHGPLDFDRICVWGEFTKRLFVGRGVKKEIISVTGCPKFDVLANRKKAGPSSASQTLLFISSGDMFRDEMQMLLKELAGILSKNPEMRLIVKMHPREHDREFFRNALGIKNDAANNISITRDENIYDVLDKSDIVILISSTVGLEALMMGKKLIVFHPGGARNMFVRNRVAMQLEDVSGLEAAVKRSIKQSGAHTKRFIRDYAYAIDGGASARIAEEIYALMRRNK